MQMQHPEMKDFLVTSPEGYQAYVQWHVDMPFYTVEVGASAQVAANDADNEDASDGIDDHDGAGSDQEDEYVDYDLDGEEDIY